jgi:hypothetical protein
MLHTRRECEELVEAIEYLEGLELESTKNAMIEANEHLEREKDNLMQEMAVLEARLRAERETNHRFDHAPWLSNVAFMCACRIWLVMRVSHHTWLFNACLPAKVAILCVSPVTYGYFMLVSCHTWLFYACLLAKGAISCLFVDGRAHHALDEISEVTAQLKALETVFHVQVPIYIHTHTYTHT